MLEKWKRAVIHLECAADSKSVYDFINNIDDNKNAKYKGDIIEDKFEETNIYTYRDIRYHGTALFMLHAGRRYLLTARHVVHDEISAKQELERWKMRPWQSAHLDNSEYLDYIYNNTIHKIIFKVPSIDEVILEKRGRAFLMNLGAGTMRTAPYTFSDPELDLAVISLDQRDSQFADDLEAFGYSPLRSEDIAHGPDVEGQDLFTIGFPSPTALVDEISLHPSLALWSSRFVSAPVFAFGKVSMCHEALPFFWADLSVFPGNSGGPVVSNDRLIGIVSGQATLAIDNMPEVRTRIPFGRIIKAKFVHGLLEAQEAKDRWLGGSHEFR